MNIKKIFELPPPVEMSENFLGPGLQNGVFISPQGFAPPQLLASQRVVDRSAPMAAKALPDEPRFQKTRWFPIFPLNPGWFFWGGCFSDGLSYP